MKQSIISVFSGKGNYNEENHFTMSMSGYVLLSINRMFIKKKY